MDSLELNAVVATTALEFQRQPTKDVRRLLARGLDGEGASVIVVVDLDVAVMRLFHLCFHPMANVTYVNVVLRRNTSIPREIQFVLVQFHGARCCCN